MGGLGNQMFQFAFARSLSLELDTEFYLNTNFFEMNNGVTPRKFSLDEFPNLKYKIFSDGDSKIISEISNKKLLRLTDSSHFNFINFSFDRENHYFLDGYWQTDKYFSKRQSEILNDFLYTEEWKKNILEEYPSLNGNATSLHVRRTDYLFVQDSHPVLPKEYYDKAVKEIGDYDYILIFSDDMNWCKDNLTYENMIFVKNKRDLDDLWMMSLCTNNIIANSSFSWWGAWLNLNKNKKVISPTKWFGEKTNLNTSDLIPSNWIKI